MKKNIREAIKEHLYANAFATDPNNPGFVDRFFEHTKAAEWGAERTTGKQYVVFSTNRERLF